MNRVPEILLESPGNTQVSVNTSCKIYLDVTDGEEGYDPASGEAVVTWGVALESDAYSVVVDVVVQRVEVNYVFGGRNVKIVCPSDDEGWKILPNFDGVDIAITKLYPKKVSVLVAQKTLEINF